MASLRDSRRTGGRLRDRRCLNCATAAAPTHRPLTLTQRNAGLYNGRRDALVLSAASAADAPAAILASTFFADVIAGITVGIIALALSMALGIASDRTPAVGIVTAIIAGFLNAALSGSKVQIGGPHRGLHPHRRGRRPKLWGRWAGRLHAARRGHPDPYGHFAAGGDDQIHPHARNRGLHRGDRDLHLQHAGARLPRLAHHGKSTRRNSSAKCTSSRCISTPSTGRVSRSPWARCCSSSSGRAMGALDSGDDRRRDRRHPRRHRRASARGNDRLTLRPRRHPPAACPPRTGRSSTGASSATSCAPPSPSHCWPPSSRCSAPSFPTA